MPKEPPGTASGLADPSVTELAANVGFDCVFIDGEHGVIDRKNAMEHLMAVKGTDAASFYRVPSNSHTEIKKIIDFGPAGIIVPMVMNAEEAKAAIAAMRYPPALGTAVAHRLAIDAAISDSMLLRASDGSLYLASGRGDGFRDLDRETAFHRSTDGGMTWTENAAPRLAAGSVSLFERDGKLFALGLKNVGGEASLRTFAVWQLVSGAWEEKSSFAGIEGNVYALGTGTVAFYNGDTRFYKAAVCYFGGTNGYPAYVSFAYADGSLSDGTVTVTAVNGVAVYGQLSSCTVADVLPADTLIAADNTCHGLYSFVDKRGTGAKFRVGPERTRNVRFNSRTGYTTLSAWMLPAIVSSTLFRMAVSARSICRRRRRR